MRVACPVARYLAVRARLPHAAEGLVQTVGWWKADDADGDRLTYTMSYRKVGDTTCMYDTLKTEWTPTRWWSGTRRPLQTATTSSASPPQIALSNTCQNRALTGECARSDPDRRSTTRRRR